VLLALAGVKADALADEKIRAAAVTIALRLGPEHKSTDSVFYALGYKSGGSGLDVLYAVIERDPTSTASKRAENILAVAGVADRGSPALRVTWELHRARCNRKRLLFKRAGDEGDERTPPPALPGRTNTKKAVRLKLESIEPSPTEER
jgi:hypothetical protein